MLVAIVNRFLHWSVVGIMTSVLVLMILSKHVPLELVGVVMAVLSTAVVVFEVPSGMLSDIIGRKKMYLTSIVVSMLGYVVLIFGNSVAPVLIGFFFRLHRSGVH